MAPRLTPFEAVLEDPAKSETDTTTVRGIDFDFFMTTYKYSVPWLEFETAIAPVTTIEEWSALSSSLDTVIPHVDLPGDDEIAPVRLTGGVVRPVPGPDERKVYRALKKSRKPPRSRARAQLRGLFELAVSAPVQKVDLQAVHAAYLELVAWAEEHPTSHAKREATWAVKVATATAFAQVHNCKMDPVRSKLKMDLIDSVGPEAVQVAFQVWEAVRLVKRVRHSAKAARHTALYAKSDAPSDKRRSRAAIRATARSMVPASFPTVEFWAGRVAMHSSRGLLLMSTGDLQRLEQYAAAIMNISVVLMFRGGVTLQDPTDALAWVTAEAKRMSEGCLTVGRGQEVHVARAYMQAYEVALASKSGRRSSRSHASDTLGGMPHAEACGAVGHAAKLCGMPIDDIVNLGKVHKALPPTSSLGAATAYARYVKARDQNPQTFVAAGRPSIPPDFVKTCMRDEAARALRIMDETKAITLKDPANEPAWFADWRDRKVVPSFPGWSLSLRLRGEARVPARSDRSPATFKDSALAPDEEPVAAWDVAPKTHANMALRRFTDPDYPTVMAAFDNLLVASARHAKSDQKPENYKDPLRLFYEAVLIDRLGVSWAEDAVYSVAQHHPCYMLGKKPRDVQQRARSMVAPAAPGHAKIHDTYDVSNWSAGMAEKIQRDSGELWAEIFDDKRVGSAYNTMAGTTVFIQKHGVLGGYVSPFANFEGYDGKAMTFMHIGLMSAVVQRTRANLGQPDLKATMMTYIDDGASTLEVPARTAPGTETEFLLSSEEIYGHERFILHASKGLVSDRMLKFLNEVYYAGTHIVCSTKAAMKVASEPREEHDSLVDRTMTLSSGTQGAVQAGLDKVEAALFCYFLAALELREWAPRDTPMHSVAPVAVALYLISPAAYGGLALPSPVGFGKTGKGASLSEGMAAMQSCAIAYPATKKRVLALFRTPLPARSAAAIMRNPTGCAGLSLLRTNRIALALSQKLEEIVENSVAKQVMDPMWTVDVEGYAKAFLESNATMSATAIQMAWKQCPVSLAEAWIAKFETSRTISSVLGPRVFRAIVWDQRQDAKASMRVAFEL